MTTSLVLTVLGPDRPGLVEQIARLVADHGGNWVESRMAHLAGQFAGILRVEVPAEQAAALSAAIAALQQAGLDSVIHRDSAPLAPTARSAPNQPALHLELVGQDRPGIVRDISRVLAAQGVNVEELSTECVAAPTTGQALFRAAAQLRLPSGLTVDDLRTALEQVAADLMVDVTIA